MNRKLKIILSGIVSAIVVYFGYSYFKMFSCMHTVENNNYKRYSWIFTDSIKSKIDTFLSGGEVNNRDVLYLYSFKDYRFFIWEFKDLSIVKLNSVVFNQNVNFDNVNISSGERKEYKSPDLTLTMKLCFSFNYALKINLDSTTKIIKSLETSTYKGFLGNIGKMTFCNEKGEPFIIFDYGYESEPCLFLLYKAKDSFFLILANAKGKNKIDDTILNMLNLK